MQMLAEKNNFLIKIIPMVFCVGHITGFFGKKGGFFGVGSPSERSKLINEGN